MSLLLQLSKPGTAAGGGGTAAVPSAGPSRHSLLHSPGGSSTARLQSPTRANNMPPATE